MKRILTAVLALMAVMALISGSAQAAANSLKDIHSSTSGDDFKIVLAFEKDPKTTVNYYQKSIQIDVPGGSVHPGKRVFDVENAGIKSVNIYQVNPDLMRIRIFPKTDMKALREVFSTAKEGGKLVLTVGHKKTTVAAPVEKLTPEIEPASKSAAPELVAPVVAAKEPASPGTPADAAAKPAEAEEAPGAQGNGNDFLKNIQKSLDEIKKESGKAGIATAEAANVKTAGLISPAALSAAPVPTMGEAFIKIGSALMIVLALIVAVSYGAKKYLGAMETGLGTKKQLKVLSNHFIGVKKNVTIIEVGGEILVLGVTNSNVNLLARYSEPEKIEAIKLAHRLPDRPMGIFKKLPLPGWMQKGKKKERPVNPAFARQVASYAQNMRPAEDEADGPRKTLVRKEELVSSVARSIKDKLRAIEGTAG